VAEDFKEKAIALVFSGIDSDGLLGLKEIKNHRGICLFQKPETSASLKSKLEGLSSAIKSIPERVSETLFASHTEHYVVINESLDIQYISGEVQSFMQLQPEEMSSNILLQCKKEVAIILGQTIQRAIKTSASACSSTFPLKNKNKLAVFRFLVHPMLHFEETFYLVIHESMEADSPAVSTEGVSHKDFENNRLSDLQLELDSTREHLKSQMEELEVSKEEIQALTKELQRSKKELQGVWGTIQDITQEQDQKKKKENETLNEELLRSNLELNDFAYMASHDLQEPLRMISSFTEILEDEYAKSFDDNGKQYLSFITNGTMRMQAMLSDILKYSLINTNDEPIEPVNLNVLISEVLINFKSILDTKKIVVHIGELAVIRGVPSLLGRLFQNLISNAIKYNDGIPEISIWSTNNDDDKSIYVKDNGIGIESTHFEHIFGIFKRLHTAEEYPGSGIGLAICMRIMDKHQGNIKVLSSSKDGSVFQLKFSENEQ
jgi:signal transduction histidine kinase